MHLYATYCGWTTFSFVHYAHSNVLCSLGTCCRLKVQILNAVFLYFYTTNPDFKTNDALQLAWKFSEKYYDTEFKICDDEGKYLNIGKYSSSYT